MISGTPIAPGDTPATGIMPGVDNSLSNTLSPQGIVTQMQAELARQAAARAAAVNTATAAASKAGEQYQQAAAAPTPEVDPLTRLMTAQGGDVASIMSRNPAYAERGQQSIDQMHADLVQKRTQNLQALRDTYDTRAKQALAMGDQNTALSSQEKVSQLDKTMDQILQGQRDTAAMAREKESGANALANTQAQGRNQLADTAAKGEEARKTLAAQMGALLGTGPGGTGTGTGTPDSNPFLHRDEPTQTNYVTLQDGQTPKMKQALVNLARQRTAAGQYTAVITPKETASLKQIDTVQMGLNDIYDQAKKWLPTSATDPNRWLVGASAIVNPELKSWGTNRMAAVQQISTLMSAGTGGRMNQQMIALAIANDLPDPGSPLHPSDWKDSADLKYARLQSVFMNYRSALLGVPGAMDKLSAQLAKDSRGGVVPSIGGGAAADTSAAAPAASTKGKVVDYDALEAAATARRTKKGN